MHVRALKSRHTPERLSLMSAELLTRLESHPLFVAARTVLLYHSLPDEVCTHGFIRKWGGEKCIVLPAVRGDELELRVYTCEENLLTGSFGVSEPSGRPFTRYGDIDLAVIPGMAFDSDGNRLGRGKGYYDRLLPRIAAPKIGLCFPFQFVPRVPHSALDIPVDEVLH